MFKKIIISILIGLTCLSTFLSCKSLDTTSALSTVTETAITPKEDQKASAQTEMEPEVNPILLEDLITELLLEPTEEEYSSDFDGEWIEIDTESTMIHIAKIENNYIEIYWYNMEEDVIALYWAGTLNIPIDYPDTFSIISENDTDRTTMALLASSDDTKTFTFEDGLFHYKASALGMTKIVKLSKI